MLVEHGETQADSDQLCEVVRLDVCVCVYYGKRKKKCLLWIKEEKKMCVCLLRKKEEKMQNREKNACVFILEKGRKKCKL